jgi:hypothetical protein
MPNRIVKLLDKLQRKEIDTGEFFRRADKLSRKELEALLELLHKRAEHQPVAPSRRARTVLSYGIVVTMAIAVATYLMYC